MKEKGCKKLIFIAEKDEKGGVTMTLQFEPPMDLKNEKNNHTEMADLGQIIVDRLNEIGIGPRGADRINVDKGTLKY